MYENKNEEKKIKKDNSDEVEGEKKIKTIKKMQSKRVRGKERKRERERER